MTCREAIEEAFGDEAGVLSTSQVIERVYAKHPDQPWQTNTIQAHLIGLSVNHPSSRHYPSARKQAFLFNLGGGRYRRWNPEEDGNWVVTDHGVQVAETSEEAEVVEELETTDLGTSFSLERDLERSLLSNLAQLEPSLRLYQEKDVSGQQLDTGEVGRLDLLCIDQNDDLVVIELKAGRVNEKICGQILRYMGWVGDNLAHGRKVLGIVVASEFTESFRYAAKAMSNVMLKKYEVRFTFATM
jgi:hypothetical protein